MDSPHEIASFHTCLFSIFQMFCIKISERGATPPPNSSQINEAATFCDQAKVPTVPLRKRPHHRAVSQPMRRAADRAVPSTPSLPKEGAAANNTPANTKASSFPSYEEVPAHLRQLYYAKGLMRLRGDTVARTPGHDSVTPLQVWYVIPYFE